MHDKISLLPPVSEMMRDAGLEPKKSLGQNFLFDLNLTGKIARSVPDIENTTVVEVGPGPGGLTRALLMAGAKHIIAIEKDRATAPILDAIAAASDGRLEIIYGDALKWFKEGIRNKEKGIRDKKKWAICSNLPYNIGTELLIQWLHMMDSYSFFLIPCSLTLMFQREVAERIVAKVGDAGYGRLSVLTALVANAKILFNVPRTAFTPMPKVESAVVQIIPKNEKRKTKDEEDSFFVSRLSSLEKVERVSAKLFGQRRKMIRGIIPGVDWAKFGLTGTERAEELSPEKFSELAAANVV